jgi:hypothetical protein
VGLFEPDISCLHVFLAERLNHLVLLMSLLYTRLFGSHLGTHWILVERRERIFSLIYTGTLHLVCAVLSNLSSITIPKVRYQIWLGIGYCPQMEITNI